MILFTQKDFGGEEISNDNPVVWEGKIVVLMEGNWEAADVGHGEVFVGELVLRVRMFITYINNRSHRRSGPAKPNFDSSHTIVGMPPPYVTI